MMCGSLAKAAASHKDDDRPCWVTIAARTPACHRSRWVRLGPKPTPSDCHPRPSTTAIVKHITRPWRDPRGPVRHTHVVGGVHGVPSVPI